FASWKQQEIDTDGPGDQTPDTDPERRGVLTLETLLALVAEQERPVGLAIETKHPTRYAGLVERRLVELLKVWAVPARVMSFSRVALRRLREAAPWVPTVFLMDRVP